MRLIDADALKEHVKKYMSVFAKYDWREICEMLNDAPTVDPVKHGHWINTNEGIWNTVDVLKCSVCGEIDNRMYRSDAYCPYCGAKMDEVEDETC